jgi:putative tryptophan/tyrosine transport system substrate-binding protein
MRRRDALALCLAAAWPQVAPAQPSGRIRSIGVLVEYDGNDPEARARLEALQDGLKALGWVDGRNLRIEQRFAGGDPDRIQAMAAELTALSPDLILESGAPVTTALRSATPTIPIVFVQVSDPVGAGIVPSLSRPEGNVTGFTNFEYNMVGKWLDLLRQLAPGIVRVLMIQNPANFGWPGYVRALEASAHTFGLQPHLAPVRTPSEIEEAISNFAREPEGGMVVLPDTTTGVNRKLIVGLAQRHRIPAVYPFRFFVADGGLMSYGLKVPDVFRQAASYIDRILRGEQPSKLPVQAPTTFELVLHPKAAGALGLTFPLSLLARADEVIE